MSVRLATALRAALWLLLGCWLGAWILFAALVAPAAFQELGREPAGRLVGEVLPPLQLGGVAAGVALALLARALGRGPAAWILPLALSALGLLSLFGITPRMEEIRDLAFEGPGDPEARARFARLHLLSGLLYVAVGAGVAVLAALHGVGEAREEAKKRGTAA